MEEQQLTEAQSLKIITEMIQKAKPSFHSSGTGAILWGTVVGIAGLVTFAEMYWGFDIHFDIWLIVLAALVPQAFLTIRERRNKKAVSYQEIFVNAIWLVHGISIFALLFYLHAVRNVPSQGSLLLMLYAIPTMATGIALKFRPMLVGAILCYVFFIVSCFTADSYDYLLNGLAGIACWLIPGLILRHRASKSTGC